MTIRLTDEEREVYTDLYKQHEKIHDMTGSVDDWMMFASDMNELISKREGPARRLMIKLAVALYDYMAEEQEIRQKQQEMSPHQIHVAEAIPWT
jgi:hypothetical protein